ncbi:MAG TPA: hypothetical protein VNA87_07175 [Actinomycetota bacterium]|nr:hypothetical protein [Actinomycetota bacterium]
MRSKTSRVTRRAAAGAVGVLVAGALLAVPSPGIADGFRAGSTTLVSHFPNGSPADGGHPAISSDGRYVSFESNQRLLSTDTDDLYDIYRKDTLTGEMVIIPKVVAGVPHYRDQFHPSISDDGQKIAYLSGTFGNGTFENSGTGVYAIMRDLAQGTSVLLSRISMSGDSVRLSGDGKWAALTLEDPESMSIALDFVDTATGQFHFFTKICGGCGFGDPAPLSQTGRYVAYRVGGQVYRHDRDADGNSVFDEKGAGKTSTSLVSVYPDGRNLYSVNPTISADGRRVGFTATHTWLTGAHAVGAGLPTVGVYVRDIPSGTTFLASKTSHVGVPNGALVGQRSSISADGRLVGFSSPDPYLVPGDFNPGWDVFVHDLSSSTTHLASTAYPDGSQERSDRMEPALSYDGRFVAFQSADRFGLGNRRIWLKDRSGTCSVICTE